MKRAFPKKPLIPGGYFCTAHRKPISPEQLKDKNCLSQPCKYLAKVEIFKKFDE